MISMAHFDPDAQAVLVEARRHAVLKQRRTIGSRDVLSSLLETDEVADLLHRAGIRLGPVTERLGDVPPSAEFLLAGLGIDLGGVRSKLPTGCDPRASPWRMRRSKIRPLRITIESPSARVPFGGSARKVLEVAMWIARRRGRPAGVLDLFRGVLSDGADPVGQAFVTSGPTAFNRLIRELAQLDLRPA